MNFGSQYIPLGSVLADMSRQLLAVTNASNFYTQLRQQQQLMRELTSSMQFAKDFQQQMIGLSNTSYLLDLTKALNSWKAVASPALPGKSLIDYLNSTSLRSDFVNAKGIDARKTLDLLRTIDEKEEVDKNVPVLNQKSIEESITDIRNDIDLILLTVKRIEEKSEMGFRDGNVKEKFFTSARIEFLIGILFSLILFFIQKQDQKSTDETLDRIEDTTNRIERKVDQNEGISHIEDKIEQMIESMNVLKQRVNELINQEKWVCERNTYLRSRPSFDSKAIIIVKQFEIVTMEPTSDIAHKWIKVRIKSGDDVISGWVPKKYFRRSQ